MGMYGEAYYETMNHLMDSIYKFIESIDKNPETILSRIQRADMSIFLRRLIYSMRFIVYLLNFNLANMLNNMTRFINCLFYDFLGR
jgi:hypothetical protein